MITNRGLGCRCFRGAANHSRALLSYTGTMCYGDTPLDRPPPPLKAARVSFSTPEPARTEVHVFDAKGRRVATLFDEDSWGAREITWHGVNDNGQRVSSGVYFVKLISKNRVATRKVSLIR